MYPIPGRKQVVETIGPGAPKWATRHVLVKEDASWGHVPGCGLEERLLFFWLNVVHYVDQGDDVEKSRRPFIFIDVPTLELNSVAFVLFGDDTLPKFDSCFVRIEADSRLHEVQFREQRDEQPGSASDIKESRPRRNVPNKNMERADIGPQQLLALYPTPMAIIKLVGECNCVRHRQMLTQTNVKFGHL